MKFKQLFFIAFRWLVARRKMTAVSVISWIAVLGMIVSSSAIVILLSAFNGIEKMIEELYSSFDQEVVVRSSTGRKMDSKKAEIYQIFGKKLSGVKNTSLFIQERVILRNKKKWSNAEMWAVEPSFISMAEIHSNQHLINGVIDSPKATFIGVGLANRLMMQSMNEARQPLMLYYPKHDKKIRFNQTPFYQRSLMVSGAFDFNREVNDNVLLMPLSSVASYNNNQVSGVLFSTSRSQRNTIKERLLERFPGEIQVLTNLEKNALIFKTSRSEKLIVLIILLFVFVLSLFNLSASITMTFIEKKAGTSTLFSIGLSKVNLRNVYFLLGSIIVLIGVLCGVLFGVLLVELHQRFGLIHLPGSAVFFPSGFSWIQTLEVFVLLILLGISVAFVTATALIKPYGKETGDLMLA